MISFANAKINLGLFVTEKRTDGFHNIESIFLPVPVSDVLEILPSTTNDISFQSVGLEIAGDPYNNLCVKAYRLLQHDFSIPGVKGCLLKNTPIGAGLGGGSSDGVQMLKSLNELFELNLNDSRLFDYATRLGSDCPFFIKNKPAFVEGRGETMCEIFVDLSGVHVVVVHPNVFVSTPEAYAMIKPTSPTFDLRSIASLPRKEWPQHVINAFEAPMIKRFPVIGEIKNQLMQQGAFYASMSGSGSAVYGLFETPIDLSHLWPDFFYRDGTMA